MCERVWESGACKGAAVRMRKRRRRLATYLDTVFHRIVLALQRLVQQHMLHCHRLLLAKVGPQITDDVVVLLLFLHQLLEVDVVADLHLLRPYNTLFRQPVDLLRRKERPLRPRSPTVGALLLLKTHARHGCLRGTFLQYLHVVRTGGSNPDFLSDIIRSPFAGEA